MNKKVHHIHKSTPSRLRELSVSPNIKKQIQRVRQNEDAEKYAPNERTRQKPQEKNLNDTEVIYLKNNSK